MYRIYTSDALFCINNNLVKMTGGMELPRRYIELIGLGSREVDTRTEEEIKESIFSQLEMMEDDE